MSIKQTSIFDFLVETFTSNIMNIQDIRRQRSDIKYKFKDIILSAFAVFYFQSNSWLGFQRNMQSLKGSSNCQTMFNIDDIPSDNHIRQILDGVYPKSFAPVYDNVIKKLDTLKILDEKFTYMDKYLLIALDGTYYHSSKNISCKCCQTRTDKETGEVHNYHSVVTPTIVNPDINRVLPLMQEFISNEDGNDKQDCEINASKRWLDSFSNPANKRLIILGDDLYAKEPMIQKVLSKHHSYIFVAKKESHKYLYEQIDMIKNLDTIDTKKISHIHNGKKQIITYNYINDLLTTNPNGKKKASLTTNWCEITITDLEGKQLYYNSFITNIPLDANNVEDITKAGRCRWKIENENNNVLKTKGYNLDHNFGHGKEYLSQTLCTLNILAFLFHTVQDLADDLYIELRDEMGTREQFFTAISFLSTMFTFKSFDKMIEYILISRRSDENIPLEGYV